MTHNVTAQYRDYLLQTTGRANELATFTVDKTEFFMLIDDTHYLLIDDTHKLYLSDATFDAATYVVNAQFRDYLLTAEQVDRD